MKGYIEKHLMPNERVVYAANLHGIVYIHLCIFVIVFCGVLLLPFDIAIELRIALLVVVILIAIIWCVIINGGKQYVVTTKRLIFKRGIIKRSSYELLLWRCESLQIEQSFWGRLMNYGTVIVTVGQCSNRYEMIKSPLDFSLNIHQQIDNNKTFT